MLTGVHVEQVKKYVMSSLVCSVLMLHSLAVAALEPRSTARAAPGRGCS